MANTKFQKPVPENLKTVIDMTESIDKNKLRFLADWIGWKKDTSHLATIIDHVPNVLNYKMVKDGWLDTIAQQIMV